MSLPIALQLYSIRDFMEQDFEGTLRLVKDMGYDGVEITGLFGHSPADVKKMLDEIGLIPVSAHVAIQEFMGNITQTVADYREIGCPYMAIPWLGEEDRPGAAGYAETVKSIETIGKELKKQGGTLLYHNHDFEFVKIDGEYALDNLYQTIPADLLQCEIDTCWVNVAGENPADYVRKYTGRAPVVHLKDFIMPGKKPAHMYELIGVDKTAEDNDDIFEFRPLGLGVQNFSEIIKAAEDAGSKWLIVEQDQPTMEKTSLECAKISIDYLKTL